MTSEAAAVQEPAVQEPVVREPVVGQPAGRSSRRRSTRRGSAAIWVGRGVAVLCVVAGIVVFAVARATTPTRAAAKASRTTVAAPGPVKDDRALLSDPDVAQAYVAAALSEIVVVSDSDYRTLDDALSAGQSVTTGGFRTRFTEALTGASAQQRRANHDTTSVNVLQVGIGGITDGGRQAKVLVFAKLHQTGDDVAPGSVDTVVTLCLTLVRHGNQTLISDLQQDANAGLPPGTTGLAAAAEAARSEVVNTLTYSRANFDADLARAQASATGALKLQLGAAATTLQHTLTSGGYDLSGTVTAVAVQQVSGDSANIMVAATGSQVSNTGQVTSSSDDRFLVTVQRVSGSWLTSSITPVDGS